MKFAVLKPRNTGVSNLKRSRMVAHDGCESSDRIMDRNSGFGDPKYLCIYALWTEECVIGGNPEIVASESSWIEIPDLWTENLDSATQNTRTSMYYIV